MPGLALSIPATAAPIAVTAAYQRTVVDGRAVLGEAAVAAAWAEGQAMSLDQAIEYALGAH